jgi:ABC-type transport system involved in multi-copper enzyme maturation permease subunit
VSRILNLARWEWFKLQRRKMLWILLAILLAITQLSVWGAYAGYTAMAATGGRVFAPPGPEQTRGRMIPCTEVQANLFADTRLLEQCRQQASVLAVRYQLFSPTGGMTASLAVIGSLGMILFGVLTASVVGSEYGIGTLRPVLTRGTGRLSFLAGKYLTLLVVATLATAAFCGAAAASGLLAAQSAAPPPSGTASLLNLAGVVSPHLGLTFLKTLGGVVTFITMTGAVTLLLRSTAAGMAICLAWYVGEGILIRLMSAAFDNFDSVADFFPMRNISALASGRMNMASPFGGTEDLSTVHSSLVLAAYVVIFAGVAALVFRRRDIAGAAGS